MMRLVQRLGSSRLMIGGFALLAAGTLLSYDRADTGPAPIVIPLALLALNLAAAIAVRPALRRGGLGLFHACLLGLLLLAGWGRLTHLDGRVEVTEGTSFDAQQVQVTAQGPWHGTGWQRLAFRQGPWEVDYAPGVRRAHTRSQTWLPGETAPRMVGDDSPLVLDGYRFYTTHNKGFAPILSWQADGGEPVLGALHLPSYPLFDYQQENSWTAPDGAPLRFWLRLERPLPEDAAWTLRPQEVPAVLVVEAEGQRRELRAGESVKLRGAMLRYERLAGWMGYKIFYDPTLVPMLVVSLLGIAALGWHIWGRTARLLPLREGAAA